MSKEEKGLTPPEQVRTEVSDPEEIMQILDECTLKDVPFQIIKTEKGDIKEHFFSDHRSELHRRFKSLGIKTEYSMIIRGTAVKPLHVISFPVDSVSHITRDKELVMIFLKS